MTLQQALSDLLQAVGVVLGILVATYAPVLRAWIKTHVKNKATAAALDTLTQLAQFAVAEIEPAATDSTSPSGSTKKAAAVAIVKAGLAKQDMTVTDAVVSSAVEKAVSDLHQQYTTVPAEAETTASEIASENSTQSSTQSVSESASQFHWGGEQ